MDLKFFTTYFFLLQRRVRFGLRVGVDVRALLRPRSLVDHFRLVLHRCTLCHSQDSATGENILKVLMQCICRRKLRESSISCNLCITQSIVGEKCLDNLGKFDIFLATADHLKSEFSKTKVT